MNHMTTKTHRTESANTLVVTVSVVATILALLGAAMSYTEHISRMAQRSRKTALAMEIADGHLEYLFSSWRNIYRTTWTTWSSNQASGGTDYALLGTNFFFTNCPTCTVQTAASPAPTPLQYMTPSATPAPIPTPPSSYFPAASSYTLTQYRIQAVDPMIDLCGPDTTPCPSGTSEMAVKETSFGSGSFTALPADQIPPAAYGPNTWQYSFFYLAAVDVTVPSMTGTVTAKVRRVFEKRFDNPWTYAMFYNDDLELQPSAAMTVDGPIQANGNLYIGTSNLTTLDRVSYGGSYVNGYSPNDGQHSGSPTAPNFAGSLPPSQQPPFLPFGWNLNINNADGTTNNDSYHELIEVPASGTDPLGNVRYYNQAGIKVLIDSSNNVTYYNAAGTVVSTSSSGNDKQIALLLNSAITKNQGLWDPRENTYVRAANVDVGVLKTAIDAGTITGFNGVIYIADTTTNGTVVTSKLGGTSNNVNTTERAIRLVNGTILPSGKSSVSNVAGLTVVSANPVYIQGNYNTGGNSPPSNSGTYTDPDVTGYTRKAAAVVGDSVNVLSGAWSDVNSPNGIASRVATNTTVNAALVSGIVPSGSSGSNYSGGGENFVRFLEDWTGKSFTYYGSMVELYKSTQGTGVWNGSGLTVYKAPGAHIYYDPNFGTYTSTPPGKLQLAAYLQQQRWYQIY
jgi:hypothetical protein